MGLPDVREGRSSQPWLRQSSGTVNASKLGLAANLTAATAHVPVPSTMIGFRSGMIGAPYFASEKVENFIIELPTQNTRSTCLSWAEDVLEVQLQRALLAERTVGDGCDRRPE